MLRFPLCSNSYWNPIRILLSCLQQILRCASNTVWRKYTRVSRRRTTDLAELLAVSMGVMLLSCGTQGCQEISLFSHHGTVLEGDDSVLWTWDGLLHSGHEISCRGQQPLSAHWFLYRSEVCWYKRIKSNSRNRTGKFLPRQYLLYWVLQRTRVRLFLLEFRILVPSSVCSAHFKSDF